MARTLLLVLAFPAGALAHHDHAGDTGRPPAAAPSKPSKLRADGTTGQGEFTFRHRPVELPGTMRTHLKKAHGGFAVHSPRQGGDDSAYFALSGVGLLRLDPGLTKVDVVGGDSAFVGVNIHNTCVFRRDEATYLALPSDQAQKVFITDTSGKLIRELPNPYGTSKPFRVCDVEVVNGTLFAANGYADNVIFSCDPLRVKDADPKQRVWNPQRFGGQGSEHGRFGTAHGITRVPDTDVFSIADRANSRIESYSPAGHYIGGIRMPDGCLPCDIDYHGRYAVVGCLKGPGGSTPAPIYILEDGNVVAELNIGKDLGLEGFTHIHNAAFRVVAGEDGTEQFFVLAYAWNPGNFAVLEQVR